MKKKLNILLIVLVLIIYGGTIYKFIGKTPDKDIKFEKVNMISDSPKITKSPEKFELILPQRDPFLGKVANKIKEPDPVVIRTSFSKNITAYKTIDWPEIQYLGFLELPASEKVAILRIDKQVLRFTINQSNNLVTLTKMMNDSVEVKYKNVKKIIKK